MQPDTARARFWRWFEENGDRLRAAVYGPDEAARDAATEELREAVQEVEPGLVLELGRSPDDGPGLLIVSADGRPERVDAVKDFVASAPRLPGWEVVAFRPRMQMDSMEIAIQGERLGPRDIWFDVAETPDGVGLTLYVRDLDRGDERIRALGASLLAEHAVGEQDALTLLSSLDVRPLPADPAGLRPFGELPGVLDAAREARFPPPGRLPIGPEGDWQGMQGTIEGSPAIVLLHSGLDPVAGHPAYDQRLTVTIPFHDVDEHGMPTTREEFEAASAVGDEVGGLLKEGQESLHALTITSGGRRELVFYTADAEAARRRVESFQAQSHTHRVEVGVERDSYWGVYRTFRGAGHEADEQPGAEPGEGHGDESDR